MPATAQHRTPHRPARPRTPPPKPGLSAGFKAFAIFLWLGTATALGYGAWLWQDEILELFAEPAAPPPLEAHTRACLDEYYDVILSADGSPVLVLSPAASHRAGLVAAEARTDTNFFDTGDMLTGLRNELADLYRDVGYLNDRGGTHREMMELRNMILAARVKIYAMERIRVEKMGQRGPEFLKACVERVARVKQKRLDAETRQLAAERPPHHIGSRTRPSRASRDDASEQVSAYP